jgi:hypothetical protein
MLVHVNMYLVDGLLTKIIIKMFECKTRESNSVIWTCISNRLNKL